MDWWAAHREHQQHPDGARRLVTALARLYAYLYSVDEAAVRPAAELRAEAMDLSDGWVAQGCPPRSPLSRPSGPPWSAATPALLAAVHRSPRAVARLELRPSVAPSRSVTGGP